MIEHLVFLLEEPSAQDFLEAVLPALLTDKIEPHFLVFEGKQDLERQLVRRMRGWMRPNSQFVVMRDQDSAPCRLIKQRLQALCHEAGRPDAVVRIACKELEAFFVGDWQAVAQAFECPQLAAHDRKAKFRDPDALGSPSRELASVLGGYQKRDGARRITPFLQAERNRSGSFRVLMRSLQTLAAK